MGNGWQYAVSSVFDPGPRKIYYVTGCDPNKVTGNDKIYIGDNKATASTPLILSQMAIVTDCAIDTSADVIFSDVALLSGFVHNDITQVGIKLTGDDILGRPDGCAPGGGMFIVTAASIASSAKIIMNGAQVVAVGNIDLAAKGDGLNGISFQAGGHISVTSNEAAGAFGCQGHQVPLITADYYRLVY